MRRRRNPLKVCFWRNKLFKNKMTDLNQTIALVFIDDSETVAGMDDDDEEEMLKRAINMSLEEQQWHWGFNFSSHVYWFFSLFFWLAVYAFWWRCVFFDSDNKFDLKVNKTILYIDDRPTQLICISDIYLSTDKYKRHSRAICYNWCREATPVSTSPSEASRQFKDQQHLWHRHHPKAPQPF